MDIIQLYTGKFLTLFFDLCAFILQPVYTAFVNIRKVLTMDEAKVLFSEVMEILKETESPPKKEGRYSHLQGPLGPLSLMGLADLDDYNEVYPNIYIGKGQTAHDLQKLRELGITHVLNAAQGERFGQVNTNPRIYQDFNIQFLGIPAMDVMNYDISQHFDESNLFIKNAVDNGGVIFVHCHQGMSRSATLVLAYLMIRSQLSLQMALRAVREKRKVRPNGGFLKQLCRLEIDLKSNRSEKMAAKTE